jgi:cytochrome P450
VAVSGWATHFDKDVYGADALEFRPERWLKGEGEDEDEYAERLRRMNKADLTWGHGDRACMGKNIARCEMYKLMATLYSTFDVSLPRDHRCVVDRPLTAPIGTTSASRSRMEDPRDCTSQARGC